MNFKGIVFVLLLSFVFGGITKAQVALEDADSLFDAGKYTEAFETYDSLLVNGKGSAQMLLKMAFIQEGLQDFTSALYYLSLYYELSGDKKVLSKMTEIAVEHNLQGYDFDDVDFIANLYDQFRIYFVLGLAVLAMAMFAVFIYNWKTSQPVLVPLIIEAVVVIGLFIATNNLLDPTVAIVSSDHTVLRSAPSAAAEPLEMIGKGHRVEVLSEDPVWVKIQWQDGEAYLRRGRIKVI